MRGRSSIRIHDEGEFVIVVATSPAKRDPLTAAERDVVALVARGMSNAEVARARQTKMRTVANQVASVLSKLGLPSRVALGAWWAGGARG